MSKWLASVQSLEEAQTLAGCLPDILDLKNPAAGALGALPQDTVSDIANWASGRCLVSATVGDLPMQADIIADAVRQMAASGVDYVKVGLFAAPGLADCIGQLQPSLRTLNKPVIAVLFADQIHDISLIEAIKQAGFAGVMLDTAAKNGQGLLDHWTTAELRAFVELSRQHTLLCGLAGALKLEDIDRLESLGADYLGFRSALCDKQRRTSTLNPQRAVAVRERLQQFGLAS
jgi:uncharacterized protein (UPF0264 family)